MVDSHIKKWRCLSEILRRTPEWYQDPVLWAWLKFFSHFIGTGIIILKQHIISSYIFLAQYPKH